MPVRHSKFFKESALAHQLLDGMQGLEIGSSYHNAFGLDCLNVDYCADMDTIFKKAEIQLCGEAMPVDIVANGDNIPVDDKSFDFVISSHVIEHFFDPIKAIKEWIRIARRYVFIICPQPDADPGDVGLPLTTLEELQKRHSGEIPWPDVDDHRHWTRWTSESFREMCKAYGWHVSQYQEFDDKVNNGHCTVIDTQLTEWPSLPKHRQDLLQSVLDEKLSEMIRKGNPSGFSVMGNEPPPPNIDFSKIKRKK